MLVRVRVKRVKMLALNRHQSLFLSGISQFCLVE